MIDKQLRDYSRAKRMISGGINLGELPAVTLPAGKPLTELDALAVVTNLMIETRARAGPDPAAGRVAGAPRTGFRARRPFSRHGWRLFDEDYAAFEAAWTRAEQSLLAPGDWLVAPPAGRCAARQRTRLPADEQAQHGRQRARSQASAMRWFGEAIAHNNDDAEALWGFGTAATRLDRIWTWPEDALVAGLPAGARERGRSRCRWRISKPANNKPEAMIPYLKDTIRFANDRRYATMGRRHAAGDAGVHRRARRSTRRTASSVSNTKRCVAEYEKKYGKAKKKKKPADYFFLPSN